MSKIRAILDCDPGLDDAAAIAMAGVYCDLVAITTVGGNAPLIDVTNNALLACQIFGMEVPVHQGAVRPLLAEPRHAAHIHGERGFDGPSLPPLQRGVASEDAAGFIVDQVRAEEGLWIIAIGPLTNVALALRNAPDIAERLAGISFMGGSATSGNHTPVAEFNILVDPEAADIVFKSGVPLKMAGLDLTSQFQVTDQLVADVRATQTPGGDLLGDLMGKYLDKMQEMFGKRIGTLHDPCAVLAVTHPELITATNRHVAVELNGTLTRGMTVVDLRAGNSGEDTNMSHGHGLDAGRASELFIESVAALGADSATKDSASKDSASKGGNQP